MAAAIALDELISRARDLINRAESTIAFSGAGLSAESGVPTFRDAQTGLWAKHDPMRLASPQGFAENPSLVINWYNHRRAKIADAQPNAAHRALAARPDVFNITQNVDDLLHRAGAIDVVQLHGSIARDRCSNLCGREEDVDMGAPLSVRCCPDCGASMRPAVVWFGESLPMDAWGRAEQFCSQCDVLIVIGTSAVVYPAAGLISLARSHGATIIVINTQRSEASHMAEVELIGPAGAIVPRLLG